MLEYGLQNNFTTRSCRTASRLVKQIDVTRVSVAPFELKIRSRSYTTNGSKRRRRKNHDTAKVHHKK